MPAGETKRFPVLGVASCALFHLSALAFAHWWIKFGVYPVVRGWNALGPLTGFLEFWTRAFLLAALAGIVLGGLGAWRGARPRTAAVAGLLLNLGALAALLVLTRTGRFPPELP